MYEIIKENITFKKTFKNKKKEYTNNLHK